MKFPNVAYAISFRRKPHYEVAQAAGISEWRLSRLLNGRSAFTSAERERLAEALGFEQEWLFEASRPPSRAFRSTPADNGRTANIPQAIACATGE